MPNPYFPYHALGYQCNPFRAVTDAEWVALAVVPAEIEAAADAPYLQILGDKGHGKTTTLLALTERFKQQGRRVTYEHLEVEADHFTTALEGLDGFVLDEAQRLTAGERQRLLRAGLGRLVLAGHEDLTPLFTKFNLALTTVRFDTTTLAHLRAVVARRLEFFAMPEANGWVTVSAEALTYLYKTFGADVRRSEQALYEAFVLARDREGLTEIGIAELPV